MDTNILVKDLIEEGRIILDQLPKDGFEVTTAFWLKSYEKEEWYFYIVSPLAEPGQPRGAHGQLDTLIRQMPQILWIKPHEVRLIGPSNPIAKDVLAIYNSAPGPKDRPFRWSLSTRPGLC